MKVLLLLCIIIIMSLIYLIYKNSKGENIIQNLFIKLQEGATPKNKQLSAILAELDSAALMKEKRSDTTINREENKLLNLAVKYNKPPKSSEEARRQYNKLKNSKSEMHDLFAQKLYTNENKVDANEEAVDFFELKPKYNINKINIEDTQKNIEKAKSNEPFSLIEGGPGSMNDTTDTIDSDILEHSRIFPLKETGYDTYETEISEAIEQCKAITQEDPCQQLGNPVLSITHPETKKNIDFYCGVCLYDGSKPRKIGEKIMYRETENDDYKEVIITKVNSDESYTAKIKNNDGSYSIIENIKEDQIQGSNTYTPSFGNKYNSVIPGQTCLKPSEWVTTKEKCEVIRDVNYCKQMDGDANNGCMKIQPKDQERCGWCPSTKKTIPLKMDGKLKNPKYTADNEYYPADRACNYDWQGFGYEKGPLLVDDECGKVNQCMGDYLTKNATILEKEEEGKYSVELDDSIEYITTTDGTYDKDLDINDCKKYAKSHNLVFTGGDDYKHQKETPGCFTWGDDAVYFNNNMESKGNCNYRPGVLKCIKKKKEVIKGVDIRQIKKRDDTLQAEFTKGEKVKISMYGLDSNKNEECKKWVWNNVGCNLDVYPDSNMPSLMPGISNDDMMDPKIKKSLGYSYFKNIKSSLLDISNNTKSKQGNVNNIEKDMLRCSGKINFIDYCNEYGSNYDNNIKCKRKMFREVAKEGFTLIEGNETMKKIIDENINKTESVLGKKHPDMLQKIEKDALLKQNNRNTLKDYVLWKNGGTKTENGKRVQVIGCETPVLKPVGSDEQKAKMTKKIEDRNLACKYIYGDDYIPPEPEDIKPGVKIEITGKIDDKDINLKGYAIEADLKEAMDGNVWWKVLWMERKMGIVTRLRETYKVSKNDTNQQKIEKYNNQRKYFGWPGEIIGEFKNSMNREIINNDGIILVNSNGLVNQQYMNVVETCNSGTSRCGNSCKEIVSNLLYQYKRPNDCIYSKWGPWKVYKHKGFSSICNLDCFDQYKLPKKERVRKIVYQAELGGRPCARDGSDLKDIQNCSLNDMAGRTCYDSKKYNIKQGFQGYMLNTPLMENYADAEGVNINKIEIGDGKKDFCLASVKVYDGVGKIIKQETYNTSYPSCNKKKYTINLGSENIKVYKLEIMNHPNMRYQNNAKGQVIKYITRGNVEKLGSRGKLTHKLKQLHFPKLKSHVKIEDFTNRVNTYNTLGNNKISYCVNDYLKK